MPGAAGSGGRPNVILVITDDQGYGDMACHGNDNISTPNLDILYDETIHLTNFHVAPTCAPTRAGLMTGRACNRTGVWHTVMGRSLLRADEVTLADVFSDGGYKTGIFGKWHLGDNYPYRPQDRGFQESLVHGGGGVGQIPDYWGNDYFDDTYLHNGVYEKRDGYCTDVWFDAAMAFIEENSRKPFFVYLTTNAPHSPYLVSETYAARYKDKPVIPNPEFYGMITNIDDNMARLERKLTNLGLKENTIFIFMTDNGTAAGFSDGKGFNAGMRGTKGSEYDGGHRVPCFIRWPEGGITGSRDISRITAHLDLMPTLIDFCGLPSPKGVMFDGTSIAALLRGGDENWPDRVIITDSQRIEHPEKWRKSAVMTDRWRLINGTELYDIDADPGQTNNVADRYPDVVRRLRHNYDNWWESVSERFDEYCPIVLGTPEENPSRLICHDWHGIELPGPVRGEANPPWNQPHILRGMKANGFWTVDISRSGTYEISLRRWPDEVDAPVAGAIPGGEALPIVRARLKIGSVDKTIPVWEKDKAAVFTVRLEKGPAEMKTWFSDITGDSFGAYYVYVKRMV